MSFPISLVPGWSRTCERNRFLIQVFVTAPVAMACAHYINAAVWLLVFVVGAWPFPYRARWTPEGLDVWWLFIRERLRIADIEHVRLRTNVRYFRIYRYERALELELVGRKRAVIVEPRHLLETLHGEFTTALATSRRGSPSGM